ncbi:MAG: DUF882 domain-containing protein, partial [Alphaproteobacteria bacterium]|nr:DUF882 domain-containing protein [Alphaproteobacteria bacterium]
MQLKRRDFLLATGLTLVFGSAAQARVFSEADPFVFPTASVRRRLRLRHAHTGETFEGLYRDEIGPIPEAMVDLAIFLRDHHDNLSGPVFIETLDFLADLIETTGHAQATILSAYRTKRTNAMLAARIFGVAEKSQHLAGRALDITLDSKLQSAASVARRMSRGGVGWYPSNHFIHLDSGPIRNWTIDATAKIRGRDGRVYDIFQPARIAESGKAIKRPLTVKER